MEKNKLVLVKIIISVITLVLCVLSFFKIINGAVVLPFALAALMIVEAIIERGKKLYLWIDIALAVVLIIFSVCVGTGIL